MATSIPKTMKGVLIEKTGGTEVLQYKTDLPVPTPKEGELLVKNDYIGINFIDIYYRTGLYPAPKPEILGREAEGTIVATGPGGDLYGLKPGDHVIWMGTAAYAEYSVVSARSAHATPAGLAPGVAVAAFLQGLTAITLIRDAYHVQKGDWILVHAAAGGVGLLLVQLLHAVGAKVIGTASTAEKIALAKENGADYMINYKEEKGLVGKVKEITGGEGCAAVFDSVGKDMFDSSLEMAARKGTVVSYGNSSGPVPPFTISRLSAKNLKLMRPTLFNFIATREEFERYAGELYDFVVKGELNVKIHEVYPLADVARAQKDMESRKTTGKLLLKP